MPIYEYKCAKCGCNFEKLILSGETDEIKCPSCDSSEFKKLFSKFSSASSSRSECDTSSCGSSHGNCGGCHMMDKK